MWMLYMRFCIHILWMQTAENGSSDSSRDISSDTFYEIIIITESTFVAFFFLLYSWNDVRPHPHPRALHFKSTQSIRSTHHPYTQRQCVCKDEYAQIYLVDCDRMSVRLTWWDYNKRSNFRYQLTHSCVVWEGRHNPFIPTTYIITMRFNYYFSRLTQCGEK